MTKNSNTMVAFLFGALFMIGVPLSSYAGQVATPPSGENTEMVSNFSDGTMHKTNTAEELPSNGKGAAKGCATGATVGTILFPGIGTLAGCAIVGIVGWFW